MPPYAGGYSQATVGIGILLIVTQAVKNMSV